MPYTADQIGQIDVRPFSARTKSRMTLVLIQHGREPGHDETHVTVLAPVSWPKGRQRTLEMLANGIDLNDIRFARVPDGYVGDGNAAGDGSPLEHAQAALWWSTRDDFRRDQREMTTADYARFLLSRRGA